MCLIIFDWRPNAVTDPNAERRTPALLTLLANRDESLARPSAPLDWWADDANILGGRDLIGGGTWLGVTRDGRFAALTNYRAPTEKRADAPTRGALVADFLRGAARAPLDYLAGIERDNAPYNGFTLLAGRFSDKHAELACYSNRDGQPPRLLPAGLYGLSNAFIDSPWPKVVAKKRALADTLSAGHEPSLQDLLRLMRDPARAADNELPSTGVPLERERALSAAFIEAPGYGTRGTTVLRVTTQGSVEIVERSDYSESAPSHIERPGSFERSASFDMSR